MSSCFNRDWHGRQLGFTAALLAMLACGSANAQSVADNLPFESSASGRVYNGTTPLRLWHTTRGYGMEASQTAFGGRLAVDLADAIGFVDGQFRVSNESQFGMDIGGGFRWMAPSLLTGDMRIFGVTGWYDGQETNLNNYFNQLGVSFESLGEQIDFRLNANIPLENERSGDIVIDTGDVAYFQNFLAIGTLVPTDVALRVVDFEVAPRIFDLNAWIYAGAYQMDGNGVSDLGAKGGVRGYVTNDLAVDLGIQDDDTFGTNTVFQIIWTPGRTGAGPTSWIHTLADRMREQVYRNSYVATTQVERAGTGILTDVDGQDIRVVHVDFTSTAPGNGTFENPYASLDSVNGGGSLQGDIILVHAQDGANVYNGQSVTLKDEQRFLGEGDGIRHQVVTQQLGTIDLPETRPGAYDWTRPTIQNAPGAAVTLAGITSQSENFAGMEVSNFVITGGANAIVSGSDGVATANLNNLAISDTTGDAIALAAMTQTLANNTTRSRFNVTIDEVTFDNVGEDDIQLTSTTAQTTLSHATAISNITSTNGHGVGINLIQNQRAATISNFDWDGGTTGLGALRIFEAGTQGSVTLSNPAMGDDNIITGGLVGSAYAISIENSAATHTVTGTKINDMGGDSVVVSGGAANLNFTGEIEQSVNAQSILSVTGGHTGTLTFVELTANNGVITATTGDGLQFDNADGTYVFTDKVSFNGTSAAVNVVNGSGGTISFQEAEFTDTTGTAISFVGGTASMNFTGRIEQSTAQTVLSVTGDHDGTLTFTESTANAGVIEATAGNGLQFDNANGAYIFNDKVTLAGADPVINVNASDDGATFTFAEVDIDYEGAGAAVTIGNSDLQAFTISGDIDVAAGGGRPVLINNNTGGSITFNTTIDSNQQGILVTGNTDTTIRFAGQTTLITGANDGVTLTNNTNGGVRFDNVDVTTTSGDAFTATNTDNLTVLGNGNTITVTGGGDGLVLDTVEVGAAGVTFQTVNVSGGGVGVFLEDVTGGTVTVNGGTLDGSSTDGISIVGSANASFNNMTITNTTNDGINVDLTTNVASTISVTGTTINNTGELGIDYNRGSLVASTTRLTLTGNTIDTTNGQSVHIDINGSGTANVVVNGSNQFNNSSNTEALLITTSGGASKTVNLLVDGGTFENNDTTAAAARIQMSGAGTLNATVTSNSFDNATATTGRALTVRNSGTGLLRLNLNDNNGNSGAQDPYLLERLSGTFRVEDLTTVQDRNTGTIQQIGTISNDNGPIPTP